MDTQGRGKRNGRIVWGAFLMAIGGVFLLERTGWVDLPSLKTVWPAVFFVIAGCRFVDRRPGAGTMMALMGVAFFSAELGWMGLSYHTFWPLLLVAVGVGMVIRALSGEDATTCRCQPRHE